MRIIYAIIGHCQRVAVVLALGCVFLGVLKASDLLLANTCIKVELFILHGEQFYLLSGVAVGRVKRLLTGVALGVVTVIL